MKKILSCALCLILGLIPLGAFAEETQTNARITETFDSIVLDNESNEITTDSGIIFSDLGDTGLTYWSVSNGALTYKCSGATGERTDKVRMNFPTIKTAHATVAYDLTVSKYPAWGNADTRFGNMGDAMGGYDFRHRRFAKTEIGGAVDFGNSGYGFANVKANNQILIEERENHKPEHLTSDKNTHKLVYDIYKADGIYYIVFDGVKYGPYNLTADKDISYIEFSAYGLNDNIANFSIDNLEINYDAKEYQVSLVGENGASIGEVTVSNEYETPVIDIEAPKISGKVFSWWCLDEERAVKADLNQIDSETTLYAKYTDIYTIEDFESLSDLSQSEKFLYSSTGEQGFSPWVIRDGQLVYDVTVIESGVMEENHSHSENLKITLPEIKSGRAIISYDLTMKNYSVWGNGTANLGCLGDAVDNYALYQRRFLDENDALSYYGNCIGFAKEKSDKNIYISDMENHKPQFLAQGKTTHKVVYDINMDEGTYNLMFDGTTYGPYDLVSGKAVDSITFSAASLGVKNTNTSFAIDNLLVNLDVKSYTVTVYDGEKVLEQEAVEYGYSYTLAENPAKTGYYFIGYFADSEGTVPLDEDKVIFIDKDMEIYAMYEPYVTGITPYDKYVKATVAFTDENTTEDDYYRIFIAFYNAEGKMISVSASDEIKVAAGENGGEFYAQLPKEVASAKMFCFDRAMQPMTAPVEINVTYVDSIKVLAIGNSFSSDAMEYLYGVLEDAGYEDITLGNLHSDGATLQVHSDGAKYDSAPYRYKKNTTGSWTIIEGEKLITALEEVDWDIITMQQASGDSGMPDTYEPYLTELIAFVDENKINPFAKYVWHMTWAYAQDSTHAYYSRYNNDQMTMYQAICDTVASNILTRDEFDSVIPAGTAIQNARSSFVGDTLNRDGYHLSMPYGRYVAALTWAYSLFGVDPYTIDYNPSTSAITNEMMLVAKEAAKNAVDNPYEVTNSIYTAQ